MYRANKSFFRKKRRIQPGERVLLLEKASKITITDWGGAPPASRVCSL